MAKAKTEQVEVVSFGKPTIHDFDLIKQPRVTEKSMALMQNLNQVTIEVKDTANKTEVKLAFQRIFGVKVVNVRVVNTLAKSTRRGGKYNGHIPGFKKAIVTIAEGEALDLFKE